MSARDERVADVLAGHCHPGEFLTGLGDAWLLCSCGHRIEVEIVDQRAKTGEANAAYFQHVAEAVLAALAADPAQAALERVEALTARWEREAVERGPNDKVNTAGVASMLRAALVPGHDHEGDK